MNMELFFNPEGVFKPFVIFSTEHLMVLLGLIIIVVNGSGYYIGLRYIMDNNLGFGVGYDYAEAPLTLDLGLDYYGTEVDFEGTVSSELSGPYGELVYELNDYITFNGAIAFYNYANKISYAVVDGSYEDSDEMTFVKGNGTGYMLGAELDYPLYESLSVVSSIGYRSVSIDLNEINTAGFSGENFEKLEDLILTMKGLKFGVGLSYDF
jgi:hypothetical protein